MTPSTERFQRVDKLTYLYAEKEQWDKFERAAMKFLRRYLDEKAPTLKNFGGLAGELIQALPHA